VSCLVRGFLLTSFILFAACAGRPPIDSDDGTATCPDLSGTYCASGTRLDYYDTKPQYTHLPFYFGLDRIPERKDADEVHLDARPDGSLTLTLYAGNEEVSRTEIPRSTFQCDADQVAIRMGTEPWGGSIFVFAVGASSGWWIFDKGEGGSLDVTEKRRETGAVMLVVPLVLNNESTIEFKPASGGNCQSHAQLFGAH
jgi:hypothetical protein